MTPETQKAQINGIDNDPALRALLAKRMGAALTQLAVRPLRAEAVFVDDNGPKGGRAMRCALTVRLPYRPSIRVERSAVTPRLAFDAAIAVLSASSSATASGIGRTSGIPRSTSRPRARRPPAGRAPSVAPVAPSEAPWISRLEWRSWPGPGRRRLRWSPST